VTAPYPDSSPRPDQRTARDANDDTRGRFVVGAEWVGVLTSLGTGRDELRFVPGGIAHAFDPSSAEVLCGANASELEVFWIDFASDDWSVRCPRCLAKSNTWVRAQ
jgi:hypothetical protein